MKFIIMLLAVLHLELAMAADTLRSMAVGGSTDDARMAFFDSDEYAWRLFLAINREASVSSVGEPNPGITDLTKNEDNKPVVWESWALASGGRSGPFRRTVPNRSEVFLDKGEKPKDWGKWNRTATPEKTLEFFQGEDPAHLPAAYKVKHLHSGFIHMMVDPSVAGPEQLGEEVRMNRATYEFILKNNLYSVEGLEAKVGPALSPRNTAQDIFTFPAESQEVKAKWVRITDEKKARYHWRTIQVKATNGETEEQIWGLAGLHIITKDLPNWFWCSFEHVDTEVHAEISSRDSTTRGPEATKGANGVRKETENSKWQFYRLRGTQTEFITSTAPTILANSLIEHGFQMTSSCITCHARASVGLRSHRPDLRQDIPNTLPVFITVYNDNLIPKEVNSQNLPELIRYGAVGAPLPEWFRSDGSRLRYIQTDFLWSIPFRANSVNEKSP